MGSKTIPMPDPPHPEININDLPPLDPTCPGHLAWVSFYRDGRRLRQEAEEQERESEKKMEKKVA